MTYPANKSSYPDYCEDPLGEEASQEERASIRRVQSHKRPLVLRIPSSDVEICLEEECIFCKGTNIDRSTGLAPCRECIQGYQLSCEGEVLVSLMRLYSHHIIPRIGVLAEFADRFTVRY